MECVPGLIFITLFLQSLQAATGNSVDSDILCPTDAYNLSLNHQHSPVLERHLPPNTTSEKELEHEVIEDEFYSVRKRGLPDGNLKVDAPDESSFEHKAPFSSRKREKGRELYFKSTSLNGLLKDGLRIGIAIGSFSNQSVELRQSLIRKSLDQFSVDVFETAVKLLPYKLSYGKVPFYGSQADLLKEIALKNIDAAVGDILISAKAYKFVEFSQPYYDARLVMLVRTTTDKPQTWLFMSLFTPGMWFLLAGTSFFTGFVIWLVEYQNHKNDCCDSHASNVVNGSFARKIPVSFSFAFATLYYAPRERPSNNMSHLVLAPWLLLMLVVSTTFTSSFTSALNDSLIQPSKMDINKLIRSRAAIGCDGNSLSIKYLVRVLGFKAKNIRSIDSIDDYAQILASGNAEVVFTLMPYAKVFLAKYCTGFAIAGLTYDLGGFGFAFPKGSRLAVDMSEAIVILRERGNLQILEERMLSSIKCSSSSPSPTNTRRSLGPEPFVGFFIISGGASTIALLITVIRLLRQHWHKWISIQTVLIGKGFWIWFATLFTKNQTRNELELARKNCMPQAES